MTKQLCNLAYVPLQHENNLDVTMDSQPEDDYDDDVTANKPWYKDAKYNRYWCHYDKVCQWFRHHQMVTKELKQKNYRWQQWYPQQMCGPAASYSNPWDPSSIYLQHMNWAYYMYMYQQQHSYMNTGIHSYPQMVPHTAKMAVPDPVFKMPSTPAPKIRTSSDSSTKHGATDKRRRSSGSSSSRGTGSRKTRRKRKMRRRQHHRRLSIRLSEGSVTVEESDSDGESTEQFEMEITDDMLQFFAQSAKHRHLRDTEKKVNEITGEEERVAKDDRYIELAEVTAGKNKASILPPTERPGVKRTAEMKMLFGRGAAMIHGMETAMQLNFDRNCDIKQPKLWPHLPLNIKFD